MAVAGFEPTTRQPFHRRSDTLSLGASPPYLNLLFLQVLASAGRMKHGTLQ